MWKRQIPVQGAAGYSSVMVWFDGLCLSNPPKNLRITIAASVLYLLAWLDAAVLPLRFAVLDYPVNAGIPIQPTGT